MSYQIQDSITEYIHEQVENRIHDVVDDNPTIQDIKNDLDTLQGRLDEEIVNEVVKEVITKLISSIDGDYVMVKRSHLQSLKDQATESKNVA